MKSARRFAILIGAILVSTIATARETAALHSVCDALSVPPLDCLKSVELLAVPTQLQGGLRIIHRRRVSEGEQVVLQSNHPDSLPFLVLLHNIPGVTRAVHTQPSAMKPLSFDIRAGMLAELVQSAPGIQIRRQVRSLERGRVGDWIRVRDTSNGKVLRARVVNGQRLVAEY